MLLHLRETRVPFQKTTQTTTRGQGLWKLLGSEEIVNEFFFGEKKTRVANDDGFFSSCFFVFKLENSADFLLKKQNKVVEENVLAES